MIATPNIDSLSAVKADRFLLNALMNNQEQSRYVTFKDEKLFEIVHPFDHDRGLLLRIGLTTGHLQHAQKAAGTRSVLISLLLLIIGSVLANWLIGSRNYRQLHSAYEKIETCTGNILANMSDAVLAINRDGMITLINSAAEKLFAISGESVLGRICNDEISAVCPFINKALADGRSLYYPEVTFPSHTGQKFFEIKVNVLKNRSQEIESLFLVVQDITERVTLRENIKRREQIMALGQLASGVAHEIRNPLNAIAMIAQRLSL